MKATTIALLVVLTPILVSCQAADVPVAEVKPEILIEPAPGNYLCFSGDGVPQILLEEAMVTAGVCDEDVGDLKMEDPCLILSGRITNYDPEGWMATLWADGYDETGARVAHTQESALIPGQVGIDAPYQETVAFLMHLNAPQEVRTIRLHAQSFSFEHFQPGPPSTPLPQSEMIRITFSRTWLLENDVEPDEGTVTITFPESWLREPPEIPDGEETVELAVPTRLLMDHNMSDNPDEITVTFPDRYFDGL
jgi:hypothetical protein